MNKKQLNKYCIGCGLCESKGLISFSKDEKGYNRPNINDIDKKILDFCEQICPHGERSFQNIMKYSEIWGRHEKIYLAYSANPDIRHKASSGGATTALAIYLLESHKVDGIIHVGVSKESPIKTEIKCSTTAEEVIKNCGSRYTISSPLSNILQMIEEGKRYAFIGKPCDAAAITNYLEYDKSLKEKIVYVLSFFCAGLPSRNANLELLDKLNVKEQECKSLVYRGNGWPGFATAISNTGEKSSMKYEDAWGGVLGRDVHSYCRVCIDGIGERANISCADGWYLNESKNPDFSENEGRNIVFIRDKVGMKLFEDAVKSGYINAEEYSDESDLYYIQKFQYDRRATMYDKIIALRLLGKVAPNYKLKQLKNFSVGVSKKQRMRIFKGSIKRILTGKM